RTPPVSPWTSPAGPSPCRSAPPTDRRGRAAPVPNQSVRFDAAGEDYTATPVAIGAAFTVLCWFRLAVDRNSYATAWGLDAGGTSSTIALQTASNGSTMRMVSGSGTSHVVMELTEGQWIAFACVRTGTGGAVGSVRCRYGTDPAALAEFVMPDGFGQWGSQATFDRLRLGESQWGSEWLNGNLAAVKVYTRALSDAEITEELSYYAPVSTDGLHAAYPFWDGPSTADVSGNGVALTGGTGTSAEAGPGIPFERTAEPGQAPGDVFDLTAWKLTLPTEDPDDPGDADEVTQPELATFANDHFYLDDSSRMVLVAPTSGPGIETTGGSSASRCELREMQGENEAAWSIFDTEPRSLTVTGTFDPTSITGGATPRKEMIIGQIHGPLGNPPLYLACEHHVATPRIRLFKYNGSTSPGVDNMLPGITATTEITYRIEYAPGADPAGGTGRVRVYGALGGPENLPATPQFTFAPADFFDQTSGWYFK